MAAADRRLWRGGGEGPLAGVRIVDFGQYLAGPMTGLHHIFAICSHAFARLDKAPISRKLRAIQQIRTLP